MREYFGPLASWVDREFGSSSTATEMKYPVYTIEDPYLRSTSHMLGYEVRAIDGHLGILEGFIMDQARWRLGYPDVKGGDWLQDRPLPIPTHWVESVSWAELHVDLHHTRAGI